MSTHHTPYNCAIDLLGAPLPTGRLYNVSKLKGRQWPYRHTGCRHHLAILFCFRNCFFFFPSLRIRTKLRPCIDFRGLNKITARYNTHCLYCPLLLSCYTTIFSKLNLLVRIREWGEWKTTNPLGGFGCCFSGPGK